jgi:outer membrane protein assembly factor BamE
MNRAESRMAMHRKVALALALFAAATLLGGCVYRPDIQQGNLLSVKDIEQVTVGMSRSQVRFLLGTPMVSDPFAPHRWDYVYRMQYGRDRKVDSAHFIVFFEGDKVVRVESHDVPEPQHAPSEKRKKKDKDVAATDVATQDPPPLPSVAQPQPDSPQPGSD